LPRRSLLHFGQIGELGSRIPSKEVIEMSWKRTRPPEISYKLIFNWAFQMFHIFGPSTS
jgi:hypothetical protein